MSDEEKKHWLKFAELTAKSLSKLERKSPSECAVMFLTALETLLEDVHDCPPGMISAHLQVPKPTEVHPGGIGQKIAQLEPVFSIDGAADLYGCPQEVQNRTVETIQQGWDYLDVSLLVWRQKLSEIEDMEEKQNLVGAFKVSFMGCCHLRNFGLWHGDSTVGPRHLKEEERLDPWVTFSNFSQLNDAISQSAMLIAFDHFNQFGEWPEEE